MLLFASARDGTFVTDPAAIIQLLCCTKASLPRRARRLPHAVQLEDIVSELELAKSCVKETPAPRSRILLPNVPILVRRRFLSRRWGCTNLAEIPADITSNLMSGAREGSRFGGAGKRRAGTRRAGTPMLLKSE